MRLRSDWGSASCSDSLAKGMLPLIRPLSVSMHAIGCPMKGVSFMRSALHSVELNNVPAIVKSPSRAVHQRREAPIRTTISYPR